ncbi:5-methylcytosine-specific restriction enzyme A [Mesorhizobium albiziae]|uniref:5-methylcytosine-specific restriction enzyme A n=1 Tax=Neomesorhizobium albiziae TaxID=335020 RepID=A0A1I4E9B1_9HYPH|nr:hypothetical protein [Mesorhizobium albiziae]GLS33852.1 hypothetical protein GCM10007937_55650 [Mesorhizobium albiziae]SFL01187.1 5-methylcytosine-specific restriction enzyme A [Mesorhizobium albiziae]
MLNGVDAKHALYREDGRWYNHLELFPGALFDAQGYVVFETQDDYGNCPQLRREKELNVTGGICNIPGYVRVR